MTYDFDLCNNAACLRRYRCKRYRAHEEAIQTKYPYPLWYVVHNSKSGDCTYFIEENFSKDTNFVKYTLDKNK